MQNGKPSDHETTAGSVVREIMTKRDLADYLQCSIRQIEILTAKKRLPKPIYLGTSSPRWRRSELIAHLDAQREGGAE